MELGSSNNYIEFACFLFEEKALEGSDSWYLKCRTAIPPKARR